MGMQFLVMKFLFNVYPYAPDSLVEMEILLKVNILCTVADFWLQHNFASLLLLSVLYPC